MKVHSNPAVLSWFAATLTLGLAIIGMAGIALADPAVRDHRASGGAPQGGITVNGQSVKVTPPPKIGGPKWKGGYQELSGKGEKGGSSGATVRDHRK